MNRFLAGRPSYNHFIKIVDLVIQQQHIRDTSYAGTAHHSGDYLTVQVSGVPFEQTLQCEMDLVTTGRCSSNGETIQIVKVVNFNGI
jgi:hypothetical protein